MWVVWLPSHVVRLLKLVLSVCPLSTIVMRTPEGFIVSAPEIKDFRITEF